MHFGNEYSHSPNLQQKQLVKLLFKHGANIILGSHPHVLQPLTTRGKKQFVIYSLIILYTTKLKNNQYTQNSVILNINVKKDEEGKISISGIHYVPTLVHRKLNNGRKTTEVIPIREELNENNPKLNANQRERMKKMIEHSIKTLKGI